MILIDEVDSIESNSLTYFFGQDDIKLDLFLNNEIIKSLEIKHIEIILERKPSQSINEMLKKRVTEFPVSSLSSIFLKILTSNNEELTYIKSYFNLHSLPINFWLSNLKDLEGLNDFYLRKIYSSLIIQGTEEAGPNAFRIKVSLALEVCKELWPKSFNVLESLLEEGLIFKSDLNCLPPGILKFKLTGSWEYPMSLVWGGEFVGVKASQDYKVYAELLRVLEIEERLKIELPEIKNLLITHEIPRPIITDSAWEAIKTKKYFEPKFLGEDEMNLIHLVGLWCERDEEVREAVGGWLRGEKGVEGSGSAERGEVRSNPE